MKPFEKWQFDELEDEFGIVRKLNLPLLNQWISAKKECTDFQKEELEKLKNEIFLGSVEWNEDDLKFFFIAPLIRLISFKGDGYKTFNQRTISAILNNIPMRGRVELMVATGKTQPKKPFFFIHEYKPESKGSEPLGQLLAAMLTCEFLNEQKIPVFGCYVVGKFWYFVVLEGKEYDVSHAYDTSTDDIIDVFSILMQAKIYIEENIKKI